MGGKQIRVFVYWLAQQPPRHCQRGHFAYHPSAPAECSCCARATAHVFLVASSSSRSQAARNSSSLQRAAVGQVCQQSKAIRTPARSMPTSSKNGPSQASAGSQTKTTKPRRCTVTRAREMGRSQAVLFGGARCCAVASTETTTHDAVGFCCSARAASAPQCARCQSRHSLLRRRLEA